MSKEGSKLHGELLSITRQNLLYIHRSIEDNSVLTSTRKNTKTVTMHGLPWM